jgi:hypothetical protein
MTAHGSDWHEGYDTAVREYEGIITDAERDAKWAPVWWLLMWLLGVVAGFAMAVAR